MRINLLHLVLVLISLLFHFQGISQVINRDPETRKDVANVFYKPQYTLFDLRSDEPILPQKDGKYHIYYASNEVKTPSLFVGSASELKGLIQYKFKDFESCKLWCDGIPFIANSEKTSSNTQINNTNQSAGSSASTDSIFKFLVTLGKDWNKPVRQYDTVGIHNQFFLLEEGCPLVIKPELVMKNSKQNGLEYLNEMDFFLKGLDSIGAYVSNMEKELSSYKIPVCLQRGSPKPNIELYDALLDSKNIVIFNNGNAEEFNKLCKKHSPKLDWSHKRTKCDNSRIFVYFGITCSKFEKRFAKSLKRGDFIRVDEAKRKAFIKSETGLDEKYFNLIKEIIKYKHINDFAKANFFKKLEAPSQYDNFLYWGPLSNGVPNGFGFLLGKNKKLILSAYWSKGIPIVLYNLNTYHNTDIKWESHKYLVPNGQGLCKNMIVSLTPLIYEKENISTFEVYLGEYKNENDWERLGFGTYYFQNWKKSDRSLYSGYWESNKYNGEGGFYRNGYIYSGKFEDGALKYGTCDWPDNSKYIGELQNFNMHGIGKLTYANGEVKDGYFQNNSYKKSLGQYIADEVINAALEKEKEERRIQEEKALEEKRKEQELKDNYAGLLLMKNYLERAAEFTASKTGSSSSTPSYSNQQNSQKPCTNCNKTFKKPYSDDRCAVYSKEVSRPGYVLCSTCFGWGYMRTHKGCNCSSGQCYEKDCYVSGCDDGWDECHWCRGKGYK